MPPPRHSVEPTGAVATRTALLDAAERLFAEHGIAPASLRAITQQAGANLASVHYHFGSKEELVRAVLARRLEPLNRERLRRLAEAESAGGENLVEGIVHAFVAPPLLLTRHESGRAFAQLVARAFLEPAAETRELVLEQFAEVIERFSAAFARALPRLTREEIFWRFHFMAGAMAFAAGLGQLVDRYSGAAASTRPEQVAERLTAFLAAGMSRPPTGVAP